MLALDHPSADPSFPPSLRLDGLPADILLRLCRFLSLRSLARLARTNSTLAALARSDLLWRPIVARLVGPWIHIPRLPSPLLPTPTPSTRDWTLECTFLPLLPHSQPSSSSHPSAEEPIASWYDYATQFLLPNFNYLGWHMSDQKLDGRLVLVTLDTHTGRLVAEEIVCLNVYSHSHYAPRPSPFALLCRAFLPATRPAPPVWLPSQHVHMLSSGTGYTMLDGRAHAGFQIDLFAPAYVSLPWFSLAPFTPRCVLASEPARCPPLAFQPVLSAWPSNTFACPLASADTLLARRTDVRDHAVLAGRPTDLVSRSGADATDNHYFAVSAPPAVAPSVRSPSADGGRIIYQDPPVSRSASCALWAGGRAYMVGRGGQLVECVGADERQVRFHAIDGPPPIGGARRGIEGIWVGCYGTHGCEFGKIVVERVLGWTQLTFIKVTGDANVPAGEVSWKAEARDEELKGISRARAMELDCAAGGVGGGGSEDKGGVKGKGRVANQMFREPQWINARIQLIKKNVKDDVANCDNTYDTDQDVLGQGEAYQDQDDGDVKEGEEEENIEEIRVKWIELNCIVSFWKVLGD